MHVALALLVSLRDVDTPTDPEALAESEMPLNLRRRLGLSSVVVDQIRRYEQRRGGAIGAAELASLFELISRRPDAAAIFREAGRRIARADLAGRRFRRLARALPAGLRRRHAWRHVRRLARDVSPGSEIHVERRPGALVIERSLPARAAEGGAGCDVLGGLIDHVFEAYRAGEGVVVHSRCEARSGEPCAWQVEASRAATNGGGGGAETVSGEGGAAPGEGGAAPGEGGAAPGEGGAAPEEAEAVAEGPDPTPAAQPPPDPAPAQPGSAVG